MTEAMDSETAIRVENLSKNFDVLAAVDGIDFEVMAGEIFGFLGPNGAGKTTTIRMLVGLLRPDRGHIFICGDDLAADPLKAKANTGYIPDRPFLYEKLTGREFLHFIASLYRISPEEFNRRGEKLLKLFDLDSRQDQLIESYSHGMRQKLIITSAFTLNPPVIIVDEPMVGLDPASARLVKELFRNHTRRGGAVFLSTHSLEIAEQLCDRIAIIQSGKITDMGSISELKARAKKSGAGLEEVFLELTGAHDLTAVVAALKNAPPTV